nr:hypothetical protein [Tanacetum cinerariifolium]
CSHEKTVAAGAAAPEPGKPSPGPVAGHSHPRPGANTAKRHVLPLRHRQRCYGVVVERPEKLDCREARLCHAAHLGPARCARF